MPSFARLRLLLLGADPGQQLRASQALLALAVYAAFAAVQHVEVVLGMVDAWPSFALSAYNLSGAALFYALIRSGWNLRLSRGRALTVPQMLWAMVGITWSYAITGPARGAVMLILLLVVLFGMFSLEARTTGRLVGLAIAMLGAAMAWKACTDPLRYDPRVESLHFVFAAIVLGACGVLSIRIGRMRERLQRQRRELTEALARIEKLATHDALTGLPNRRAALAHLEGELDPRRRPSPQVAVALIDLDHFKHVNDAHGHAAGDHVLRRFAELARESVRASDTLSRWGGEEFLLTMPGADALEALRVLARVRERLAASPLDEVSQGLVIRFSAGVAVCTDGAELSRAIESADRMMYGAKAAGRDQALAPAA